MEWRATVKEIYTKVLPALDDEFAKDQATSQSLDELRAKVREQLDAARARGGRLRARQGLLDLIIERNPVEVPQSLEIASASMMEAEMAGALVSRDAAREPQPSGCANSADEISTRARSAREFADRRRDRRAGKYRSQRRRVGGRVAHDRDAQRRTRARPRGRAFYRSEENREVLKQSMRREKTLDALLERAQRKRPEATPD